jgi:hypothetical protein
MLPCKIQLPLQPLQRLLLRQDVTKQHLYCAAWWLPVHSSHCCCCCRRRRRYCLLLFTAPALGWALGTWHRTRTGQQCWDLLQLLLLHLLLSSLLLLLVLQHKLLQLLEEPGDVPASCLQGHLSICSICCCELWVTPELQLRQLARLAC